MFFISIPRHVIWLKFLTRTVEDACPYKRVRSLCVCDVGRGFYSRRPVSLYITAGASPRPTNRIFRVANRVVEEKQFLKRTECDFLLSRIQDDGRGLVVRINILVLLSSRRGVCMG